MCTKLKIIHGKSVTLQSFLAKRDQMLEKMTDFLPTVILF